MEYCRSGWPAKQSLPKEYELYWPARGELTIGEDLLLCQHASRDPSKAAPGTSMQA